MTSHKRRQHRLLRRLTAQVSILALINFGSPATAFAQSTPAQQPNVLGVINNTIQGMFGAVMQARQQAQMMQQQAQMMNSLAPERTQTQARFFPQCRVPASGAPTLGNVCEGGNPGTIDMFRSFIQIADRYERHYSQMMSRAQQDPFAGTRCLEDEMKKMQNAMQRRQNTLETLMSRLSKEEQAFRDANAERIRRMDNIYGELHGTNGAERPDQRSNEALTRDFAQFYSPECQNTIGRDALNNGRTGGLVGIQQHMQTNNESAAAFRNDEASFRRQYDDAIRKIVNDLNTNGLQTSLDNAQDLSNLQRHIDGDLPITTIARVAVPKVQELRSKVSNVQEELNGYLGDAAFQIPKLDRNFSQDFGRFISNADNFFKKRFVNECVTGRGSLALSPEQILRSIQHRPTNNTGTAHTLYRQALQNILDSDAFIDDKIAQIRQLDQQYRNEITITYRDSEARSVTETPYQLYQKLIANCEQSYYQDNTFQPGQSTADSGSTNVSIQRAKNIMNDLKKTVDGFVADLQREVNERVLNCNGRALSSNACTDTQSMSLASENFCFPHAQTCSQRIMACHQEAGQVVEAKTRQLKAEAAVFNQEAEALIARQEGIMQQIAQQVIADAEFLSQYFPGADFVYPSDLFVGMPEMALRNGEMLRGGGEINFDDLNTKIRSLKDQLAQQADKINGEIKQYIAHVESDIRANQAIWAGVKTKCSGAIASIESAVNEQNQLASGAQKKSDEEVGEFCSRFEGLASTRNPMAGCDGPYAPSALADTAARIASHLTPDATYAVQSYAAICTQVQSESNQRDRIDDNSNFDIQQLCKDNRRDLASVNTIVVDNFLSNLPSHLQRHKDEIKAYLLSGARLPEGVSSDDQRRLSSLRGSLSTSSLETVADDIRPNLNRQIFDQEETPAGVTGICANLFNRAAGRDDSSASSRASNANRELNRNLSGAMRSIASSTGSNTSLDQEWNRIGQRARGNCVAQHNSNRNGNNFMGVNLPMPSAEAMQNLGLGR
jgi:hypothetical protein